LNNDEKCRNVCVEAFDHDCASKMYEKKKKEKRDSVHAHSAFKTKPVILHNNIEYS